MPAAREEKKKNSKKRKALSPSPSLSVVSLSLSMVKKKVFQFIKGNSQQQFNRWRVREKGEEKKIKIRKKKNVSRYRSVLSLSQLLKPNPKEENRKEGEKIEDEKKASK